MPFSKETSLGMELTPEEVATLDSDNAGQLTPPTAIAC